MGEGNDYRQGQRTLQSDEPSHIYQEGRPFVDPVTLQLITAGTKLIHQ